MQLNMKALYRMVGKADGAEIAIIRRHYCSQMYLNNLCTQKCIADCKASILHAFLYSQGEFVLNKYGALVYICREIVGQAVEVAHQSKANTSKNDLGEDNPLTDTFAELAKLYEATSTLR